MLDQYYYISADSTRVGPIPWAVLDQLNRVGTVSDETLTASEGASEWKAFRDLKAQREIQSSLPQVPRTKPQSASFNQPVVVDEGVMWLRKNLDKLRALAKNDIHRVGIAFGIACVIIFAGVLAWSLAKGGNQLTSDDDQIAEQGRRSTGQFEQNMRLKEALSQPVPCRQCRGTGKKVLAGFCSNCQGRGTVQTPSGFVMACSQCGGSGNGVYPCDVCKGTGVTRRRF